MANANDNDIHNDQLRQDNPQDLGAVPRRQHQRLYFADDSDEDQFEEFDNQRLQDEERRPPLHRQFGVIQDIPPFEELQQQRLAGLADILNPMDVDHDPIPAVADPPPLPDPDADRDYIDNLNNAFEQLTVNNLVPPPPPVVRQQVYKLPSTGVDTTKHLVKHQIQVSELLAQQQQTINNLLFWVGNPDLQNANLGAMRNTAAQSAQVALDLKAQAVHFQANMQRAATVTDRYSSTPTMPDWNHIPRDAPMGRPCDIIAACGKFDPKQPDADFGIVWDNLRFYGANLNFRENNYRMALSFLLDGEAKRIFHDHMDLNPIPPLSTIVDTLYRAYAKPRSTIDDKQALKDVVRNANEPLPKCIARGTIAIDRQRYMHDQREWPVLRKNLIRELVYQVVEHPTQKYINWLENDSIATTGIVCDVDRLIEMVDQEEKRHGWIPKQPRNVVFQAASTGIFRRPPKTEQQQHHHNSRKRGHSRPPNHDNHHHHPKPQQPPPQQPKHHQPRMGPPQYRQPPNQHQPHHHRSRHPAGRESGKTVSTFSVNATDLDGDDTMTGRNSFRRRPKQPFQKGKHRTQSVGADRHQSRPEYRDSAKNRSRGFSHSPAPGGYHNKNKRRKPWFGDLDKEINSNYNGKPKKKNHNPSSQNQSGSKNVIVRVDKAGVSQDFLLDQRNLIKDSNVQPTFVITDPGSEN